MTPVAPWEGAKPETLALMHALPAETSNTSFLQDFGLSCSSLFRLYFAVERPPTRTLANVRFCEVGEVEPLIFLNVWKVPSPKV